MNKRGLNRSYRLLPLEEREFIFTLVEWFTVARVCKDTMKSYKKRYTDFPRPPTTKHAVWAFMQRHHLGLKGRTLPPSKRRMQVVELRRQGLTFEAIAQRLGMASRHNAKGHWKDYMTYLKRIEGRKS